MRILILSVLSVGVLNIFAQQYPFSEGFGGTLNGQLPAGWSGDIAVQGYHGMGDEKGLAAQLSSSDTQDSIVSPAIGSVNASTVLVFYYRWVMDFIYPSDPRYPNINDKLEVLVSTDSSHFSVVYSIDSFNHLPTLNFKRVQVPLGNFAGSNIQLMFRSSWGGGKYFQDIDSVVVQNGVSAVAEDINVNDFQVYPNPAKGRLQVMFSNSTPHEISIVDVSGKELFRKEIENNETIDVAGFSSGIYFLKAGATVKKIMVVPQ
ncbi:MAG: T9SS type A sorting domain-containing protein [Chitinophagales bacterium]